MSPRTGGIFIAFEFNTNENNIYWLDVRYLSVLSSKLKNFQMNK